MVVTKVRPISSAYLEKEDRIFTENEEDRLTILQKPYFSIAITF